MKRFIAIKAAAALALAGLGLFPVQAATPVASDALAGPSIAGVCFLAREAVFSNAKVGQAIGVRMRQLKIEAQAEIDAKRAPLDAALQSLNAERPRLKAEEFEARTKPISQQWNALLAEADLRTRELEVTRTKALARVSEQARPVIAQVYRSRNCGLLLSREIMLGGNGDGDLTAAVVQGLDGKVTSVDFGRERLTAAPAAVSPDTAVTVPGAPTSGSR